jgi:branched-chain amino acid transport system substrate-binding protein
VRGVDRVFRWALLFGGLGIALAGCGRSASADNHVPGRRLTIYISLPFDGPSAIASRAVLGGAEMAMGQAHARVGRYRIVLRAVNDATVASRGWDPGQTSANARLAIADASTIGYIGDLNSGASAVSIPLLNRAEIPQISPTSTAVGLTAGGDETTPGEPQKYYPTLKRTFARVIPNDSIQAAVQAQLQVQAGCRRVVVLDDGDVDGLDAATAFGVAAQAAHLSLVDTYQFDPRFTSYASLAATVAHDGADCIVICALTQNHAALVTEQVAKALPDARLFAWSGLAEATYTDAAYGGISASLDSRTVVTAAALAADDYPEVGRRFLSAYSRRYGPPQPDAIYGYEATSLMLDAISRATGDGRDDAVRSEVLSAIFATRDRHSVLGEYSINANGDTSLDRYGVYHVISGQLVFWKAMTAPPADSR